MGKITIADVRAHNARAGHYFFSRDTMRFFGTHIVSTQVLSVLAEPSQSVYMTLRRGMYSLQRTETENRHSISFTLLRTRGSLQEIILLTGERCRRQIWKTSK